ncbi:phosphoribosyltransferase family protein [Clavibacter sepedonicus]|uniref:Adenine phosphoribosyltransferase n=1 Tax=Clavibacter sepedonicus TaxID=31964 RepID=B0RG71_CLASE|nr:MULTISPECIES: phosphoribosyltransferase family protein [Clavibacter]MBD5383322.1 adenine phosphoribosyltransferase [Clavibacter sp.]UUK66377.1 hypothetical protein LRE50_03930 [Clavibacter sepedonicus]CAQ02362.1 putative adenine phosphoribosyltransferase [Clavibacter sepedonicus]
MSGVDVDFAGVSRTLPAVPLPSGIRVAYLKLYGDVELTEHCASILAGEMRSDVEVLLVGESGGILLGHVIARRLGLPYVLARKKWRPNMEHPLRQFVRSIGTDGDQVLLVDDEDQVLLAGKRVAIVDEVISSGATLGAMRALACSANATVSQVLAVATEGDHRDDVVALAHLPLFSDGVR